MCRFNYRWVLLFLAFITSSASAQVYYWQTLGSGNHQASTPQAAAQKAVTANGWQSVNFCDLHSDSEWVCGITTMGVGFGFNMTVNRYGDQCSDPDSTYDIYTGTCTCPSGTVNQGGQCVPDNPCLVKNGQPQAFTKSGSSGDGHGTISGGFVAGVQSACFGGCAVSTVDQKCTGRVTGAYTCRGTAYHTGQSCSTTGTSTEIDENTSPLPLPNPQTINEQKPCVYSQNGDSQVCQSSVNSEKEGQYCGEVNGVKTCVDSKPTKNGTVIDTKVDTETKPDGSKVVTKTDTATKIVCKGANDCKSTTTTTTTTTNVDANGNTTGVSGPCTGESCPDKNTNPDGDGDGFGDCTGSDCGEEEGGGANDWYTPGEDTYASVIEDFAASVSGIPVVASVDNFLTFTPSGACPVYSVDVWVFSVRLDQWCTESLIPWDLIKAVILGCCAFLAFRIAFL